MLSDDERARQVVLEVDTTYSYAQIPEALRPILEREIAKAFAAIREECAKVAEELGNQHRGEVKGCNFFGSEIAHAIRTAQPKAQEGA